MGLENDASQAQYFFHLDPNNGRSKADFATSILPMSHAAMYVSFY
jgi:hypothetical protein